MSRFHSYINSTKTIIDQYDGAIPLAAFLKSFFASNKKFGSKDRKFVSALCYQFFRTGKALIHLNLEERIVLSHYICSSASSQLLAVIRPELNETVHLSADEKMTALGLNIENIFPFAQHLSQSINRHSFNKSFLIQPDVYLRIRPGQKNKVTDKLNHNGNAFTLIEDQTIVVESAAKLDGILDLNKEVVVQDLNSQRVGEMLLIPSFQQTINVWDCCAASGGKSIMAVDFLKKITLTVSDIRESIISNLKRRFSEAGITNYRSFVADITNADAIRSSIKIITYDLVICDAPCSGSGTWGRTPEQLLFFKEKEIDRYSQLQQKISDNTIPFVKAGGYLLYITCSVFTKENEEVVERISSHSGMDLIESKYYLGYDKKADSMFAALFQKAK